MPTARKQKMSFRLQEICPVGRLRTPPPTARCTITRKRLLTIKETKKATNIKIVGAIAPWTRKMRMERRLRAKHPILSTVTAKKKHGTKTEAINLKNRMEILAKHSVRTARAAGTPQHSVETITTEQNHMTLR